MFSGTDLQMHTFTSTDAPLVDYDHFKSKKKFCQITFSSGELYLITWLPAVYESLVS